MLVKLDSRAVRERQGGYSAVILCDAWYTDEAQASLSMMLVLTHLSR